MAVHYKTQGFVFKNYDRLDSDRVFSIFTLDFGRVELFGKSIRKIDSKLKSGIEIFSLSEVEFIQGKIKKTLTDAIFIEKFKNIKQIPEKFEIVIKIANLIDDFVKGEEKDLGVFNLLNDVFNKLNSSSLLVNQYKLIYFYFFWNFVSILGHKPELSICAMCQKKLDPYSLYFSDKEGGVMCENCGILEKDAIKIESDIVKILRLILKNEWIILDKLKIDEKNIKFLDEISDSYLKFLLSNYQ